MSSLFAALFLIVTATLTRALLVQARLVPPTCAGCGLPFERQRVGDPCCRCSGHE